MAVLTFPVVLFDRELYPLAVFAFPAVLLASAAEPMAVCQPGSVGPQRFHPERGVTVEIAGRSEITVHVNHHVYGGSCGLYKLIAPAVQAPTMAAALTTRPCRSFKVPTTGCA